MKKRYYITLIILLAAIAAGNIFGSVILNGAYHAEVLRAEESAKATPQPTPEPTPIPTPTPVPTRPPREGDICKNFPDYDTGVNADYSYQSDEVKIAITKHINYPEAYFVADVWIRNIDSFRYVFPQNEYLQVASAEEISAENNAILATNCDFFEGIVVKDGKVFRNSFTTSQAVMCLNQDGSMNAFNLQWNSDGNQMVQDGAIDVLTYGPILIKNGELCSNLEEGIRHPRTVLGYYEPGHYLLFVCDGRQKDYAAGMDMAELADIMKEYGVTTAINLDGGNSTQMLFRNEYVNNPSKDYDGSTRLLTSMLCICEPNFESVKTE